VNKRTDKHRAWEREYRKKQRANPKARAKYIAYMKKYSARYRIEHADKVRAAHQRWYWKNGGKEWSAQWAKENPERRLAARKRFLKKIESNPELKEKWRLQQRQSAWRNNWKKWQ